MKPGTRFALGATVIVLAVGYLMFEGVKQTGTYFLTPTELATRVSNDPGFRNVGVKMGARVVPGSIRRNPDARQISFKVTDGAQTYPVSYHGLAPDTFTDQQDIEVVVEGRLDAENVFQATTLLAKCGSRYEATYDNRTEV
ncbi:MAG: cytochrome c maturation protein CcmE [Gemmatimonadales bacterium]